MKSVVNLSAVKQNDSVFQGLAPFLRMDLAGGDLAAIGQEIRTLIQGDVDNANLWMNLAIVLFCLGQRDLGLAIQLQALKMQRIYYLPAAKNPVKLRLLMLLVEGDLAANTPLDCLLEKTDLELVYYYVSVDELLALPIPEHDVLMVGISESDENKALLVALGQALTLWSKPIINAPQYIPAIERNTASQILQDAPGLLMPLNYRVRREDLLAIAEGETKLSEVFADSDFPILLRPVGSHAGRDLEKIDHPQQIWQYLSRVVGSEFFLSSFIDYSSKDGLFRKIRIALLNGVPFVCHMAVSSNWMVHYVNAGMYEDAGKRMEEGVFMQNFHTFAERYSQALQAIYHRTHLEYVCIDCAETQDGQLLVFEIDHAMVVHAMDPEDLFPYKQEQIQKLQHAFREFLFRLRSA
jgi:hypothetical protein